MVDPDDYDPEYILHLRERLAEQAAEAIPPEADPNPLEMHRAILEAVTTDLEDEVVWRQEEAIMSYMRTILKARRMGAGQ